MATEWKEVKIGEVVSIRRGASPRPIKDFLVPSGMPWVKIADATRDKSRYIFKTEEFIKEEGIGKSVEVKPGTLIVSNSATPGLPKIMGITACVHDGWLIFSEFKDVKKEFLYYKFIEIREYLSNQANGSVFQNLKTDIVRDFKIKIPSLDVQNKIIKILSALDEKIELNNKINENLHAQAQAIFKSWFVDFEPFGGTMPNDWEKGKLSDVADIIMGQSPKGESYNEIGDGEVFYQGKADFTERFPVRRLYTTEPKRMAEEKSVLLSVRAPVGEINVATEKCCIGRGLASIKSKKGQNSYLLYLLYSIQSQFDIFNGEGTVFGSINKSDLGNMNIVLPAQEKISQFEKIASQLDEMILTNWNENQKLAKIRDTLLPKLMSGELEV